MTRLLDILFATLGLIVGSPILLVLTLIGWFDTGSPLFRQVRVGRNQQFRSSQIPNHAGWHSLCCYSPC